MKKNINDLTSDEKAQLMRQEFEKSSPFENLFPGQSQVKIPCPDFYQKFRSKIENLLITKGIIKEINFPLEDLHKHIPQELRDYNFNDGVNKISAYFYENDQEFAEIYLDFIKNFLAKKLSFPFYFQSTPTIRIHCPNANNANHYPRYHSDIGYGHPPQEINFWFSLTKPIGEQKHGFRVMNINDSLKIYQKYNYHFENFIDDAINDKNLTDICNNLSPQVDTKEGELLVFDSRCNHTGEPLIAHTRVSMDIRIIAVEDYKKLPVIYQGAGRKKILFVPGGCYHQLNSSQL